MKIQVFSDAQLVARKRQSSSLNNKEERSGSRQIRHDP